MRYLVNKLPYNHKYDCSSVYVRIQLGMRKESEIIEQIENNYCDTRERSCDGCFEYVKSALRKKVLTCCNEH